MKFNKSGFNKDNTELPVQLGAGLLNTASKDSAQERMQIEYIDIDLIDPNDKNEFSIEEIENFAESIKMAGGIEQPIIVKPQDESGRYTLTTGERRWRGVRLLCDRGEWSLKNLIPCVIKDPQNVDLPLSSELKELFSILITNQYREKTDGDKLMEIRGWTQIFNELRAAGETVNPFVKTENGEQASIVGVKTRDLVAAQTNIKPAQVGRFTSLEKNGDPALINALLDNTLNLSAAEAVADMPADMQKEFVEKNKDKKKITSQDAKNFKDKSAVKTTVKREKLEADCNEIRDMLPSVEIELTERQLAQYQKCLDQIKKILQSK